MPQDVASAADFDFEQSGTQARPRSAVSDATGLMGLAGFAVALTAAATFDMTTGAALFTLLFGTALPMILWLTLVERAWARPTTGLDFANPRPWSEVRHTSAVKSAGFLATLATLFVVYALLPYFHGPNYLYWIAVFPAKLLPFLPLAFLYIVFVDRYARDPRDDLYAAGAFALRRADQNPELAKKHALGWVIKGFFLLFMLSILPPVTGGVLNADYASVTETPVALALWLIKLIFLVDVCFGAIGYILGLRVLDAHLRSPNPFLLAWVAALVCYPPFWLTGGDDALLGWRSLSGEWSDIFGHTGTAATIWVGLLVLATAVYAWATVAFGVTFSNLTHRGVITTGPYRYFKHPAYLSKNLYWWLLTLPFLTAATTVTAIQATAMLLCINAIYWLRARTEEAHLNEDPAYRAYSDWIAVHGVLPRLRARLSGARR